MGLASRSDLQSMLDEREGRGEALLGAALAAGQIDDQRGPFEAGYSPGKPCEGIVRCAQGTHGLGQPRCLAIDHPARRLRSSVARAEAGATDRERQGYTLVAPLDQLSGYQVFLVRQKGGQDPRLRPVQTEQGNNGRPRGVCKQTQRATVGDGKNGKTHGDDCSVYCVGSTLMVCSHASTLCGQVVTGSAVRRRPYPWAP